jgi:hypothetical protein
VLKTLECGTATIILHGIIKKSPTTACQSQKYDPFTGKISPTLPQKYFSTKANKLIFGGGN